MIHLRPIRITAAILAAAAIAAAALGLRLGWEKREAKSLIADAEQLSEQSPQALALHKFVSKHGSLRRDRGCDRSRCFYISDLENSPLALLHLAPPSKLGIEVDTEGDQIGAVYVGLVTVIAGEQSAVVVLSLDAATCGSGCEGFDVGGTRANSTGKLKLSYVRLGPSATEVQRRLAFQVNADCIFELGGCSGLAAITPIDLLRKGAGAGSQAVSQ